MKGIEKYVVWSLVRRKILRGRFYPRESLSFQSISLGIKRLWSIRVSTSIRLMSKKTCLLVGILQRVSDVTKASTS